MEATKENVTGLLYDCLAQLNEQRAPGEQLAKSPTTRLAGAGGSLDSLGFVNLVALVEEGCQERFGRAVMLTESSPSPDARDPFETVESLVAFVQLALAGRTAEWR